MEFKYEITELIPQREPFVLVDRLVSWQPESVTTEFVVKEGHVLVNDGRLIEAGLAENMAQTAAAGAGYELLKNGGAVKLGFIGAISKLKILSLPKTGSTLKTTVQIEHKVMNVTVVSCKIENNGEIVAQCGMKIFLID